MNRNLTVIDPFDPLGNKVGGAETYLKAFLRYLPSDFNLRFMGLTSDPARRPSRTWTTVRLRDRSFDFYPLLTVRDENVRGRIPLSFRFSRRLRAARSVIPPGALVFNRFESAWAVRKSDHPKLAFIHNDIPRQILDRGGEVLWSRFPRLFLKIEKRLIPALDFVYTPCASSVEHFKSRFPEMARAGRIRVVESLFDPDIFSPSDAPKSDLRRRLLPEREEFQAETKWVLFSGRLQEQKAPLRLIESFAELHRRESRARLVIAGTGNLLDAVKSEIAGRSLDRWVHLAGRVDQAVLPDYYRAADVLVLTSLYEGMPFCVFEALNCGLPVVSTKAGDIGRVVRNGFSGEVIPVYNPGAVAAALEGVLSRPEVYRPENCRESVAEFTPDRILIPVYQTLRDLQDGRRPEGR